MNRSKSLYGAVMIVLLIFISGAGMVGGEFEYHEDAPSETYDWLVLLYMAGDNDLGRDNPEWGNPLKMDLKEIEYIMPESGAKVLALADFYGGHNTFLYDMTRNTTREIGSPTIPLSDMDPSWTDELDMSDPSTVSTFLTYSLGNHSAKNIMFVLWDHGSGWYLNEMGPGSRAPAPGSRGFAQDTDSGGIMYLDGFRDAFIDAEEDLGGMRMDILGLDTCSMGMIEVFYQMSPWFDLGLGSEDEQPYYGYNYSFISKMGGSDPLGPLDLGKDVIDRFSVEYSKPGGYLYGTICLLDLLELRRSFISPLDNMLVPVIERMYHNENLSDHLFHSVISRAEPISYSKVDLGDLLFELSRSELQDDIVSSAGNLLTKYNEMVLYEWHKPDGRNPDATGISVYLPRWNPSSPLIHPKYHGNVGFLNFTADTLWDDMIVEYHSPVERVRVLLNVSVMDGDGLEDDLLITAVDPRWPARISGGEVLLNGDPGWTTNASGQVLLKDMEPGNYRVEVYNGTHVGEASIKIMNRPPIPITDPAAPVVNEGETLWLDASGSTDPDGDNLVYRWDLDPSDGIDDIDSTSPVVELIYYESGTHEVHLTVSDGLLNTSVSVQVQVLNVPPNPRLSLPPETMEDLYFEINASGSWDVGPDDDDLMFRYLVNGEVVVDWTDQSSIRYVIHSSGPYEIEVQVRDPDGDVNSTREELIVRNVFPTANFTGPSELWEGQEGIFDASLSTDTSSDIPSLNYSWYHQKSPDPLGYGKELRLRYFAEANLSLQLIVTDDDGDQGIKTKKLFIKNRPPTARIVGPMDVDEDQRIILNGSGSSDSEWDMDDLRFFWDLGDNGEVDGYESTIGMTFTDEGTKRVKLTVIDGDGSSSSAVHVIEVHNVVPSPGISGPLSASEDELLAFTLEEGVDSESDLPYLSIQWFVNGDKVAEGDRLEHVFTTEGEHTVEVRVRDDQLALGTHLIHVRIENPRPTAVIEGIPSKVDAGEWITASGHGSTDTASDRDQLDFQWSLDGEILPDRTQNISFKVDDAGEHTLILKVTDDEGAFSEVSVDFTVEKGPVVGKLVGTMISFTGLVILAGMLILILISVYQMTKKLRELPQPEKKEMEEEEKTPDLDPDEDGADITGGAGDQHSVIVPTTAPEKDITPEGAREAAALPDLSVPEIDPPPEPVEDLEMPDVDKNIFRDR
ncbi:MAG: PKD domain-containing protein [Thermoplasmatota archaeon]